MRLTVEHVLTAQGWLSPGYLGLEGGRFTQVSATLPPDWENAEYWRGWVVPGVPNLHSHAFQRVLSGRTEASPPSAEDSFWTWRSLMYQLAEKITPEDLEAVAAQAYLEMLEAGYTSVGEFHYLHHGPLGRYLPEEALSLRILAAAEQAELPVTLLPVLYVRGGFDKPLLAEQGRFGSLDADDFLGLVSRISRHVTGNHRLGMAPHSLRAVPPEVLRAAVAGFRDISPQGPIHIHAAEQPAEVAQCLEHLGARPVAWLLAEGIDARWCLVHATHLDPMEINGLAASGAVAGLCPTTEANLGDGFFSAREYLAAGGCFGIGSDSHASIDPVEELRWLEYGQRLTSGRRNRLGTDSTPSVGENLWTAAARGGAQALAQPTGVIAVGSRADMVRLDPKHPRLVGHGPATILDAWLFGAARDAIAEVWVEGRPVVTEGRHHRREEIGGRWRAALKRLVG